MRNKLSVRIPHSLSKQISKCQGDHKTTNLTTTAMSYTSLPQIPRHQTDHRKSEHHAAYPLHMEEEPHAFPLRRGDISSPREQSPHPDHHRRYRFQNTCTTPFCHKHLRRKTARRASVKTRLIKQRTRNRGSSSLKSAEKAQAPKI